MHLVNSIFNRCLDTVHTHCQRAEVHFESLKNTVKYMQIFPNKDEYIDFAIRNEFEKPLSELIETSSFYKD